MNKPEGTFLLGIVLMVILIALFLIVFAPAIGDLFAKGMEDITPNDTQKDSQSDAAFQTISATSTDTADILLYKLFARFDPEFLNEKSGSTIYFNAFTLDIKDGSYSALSLSDSIEIGLVDFRSSGYIMNSDCIASSASISYGSECWSSSLDSKPSSCRIYYNSDSFDGSMKLRVVWYDDGYSNGNKVIKPIITMCDG